MSEKDRLIPDPITNVRSITKLGNIKPRGNAPTFGKVQVARVILRTP